MAADLGSDLHAVVVGYGSIGRRHARLLLEFGIHDIAVVEPKAEGRRRARERLDAATYEDLDTCLSEGNDRDLAIVCTPTHLHIPAARAAVREGLDILVEKPLSHRRDGVRQLVREAQDRNLVTLVGCNIRFHPGLRVLRELLNDPGVGEVRGVQIQAGSFLPDWNPNQDHRKKYMARKETGGGALLDYVHDFDYARWLFGEVEAVSCMTGPGDELGIETEALAGSLLRFESGAVGEVHVDYLQREYTRSCRIVGTEGLLHWDWQAHQVRRVGPDGDEEVRDLPADWSMDDMYRDELRHLLERVRDREPTTAPLADGLRSLEILLAAKEAADRGTRVPVESHPDIEAPRKDA